MLRTAILILTSAALSAQTNVPTSYIAYRFDNAEGWRLQGAGDTGSSSLSGRKLIADFSKGAQSISIMPPDHVLLGNVERLRLRIRGAAKGHPVQLTLRTHFMNFHKAVGEFTGEDEQTMDIAAPPGNGWKWSRGENDGRLHGPIRVGEISFEANGHRDRMEVELLDIVSIGNAPANRRAVLTAEAHGPSFLAQIRTLLAEPTSATLRWTFLDWDGVPRGGGERKIVTRAPGEPLAVEIAGPELPASTKFLEAVIELDIPGQEVPGVRPCWIAAPPQQTSAKLDPASPFGMGIYLGRYQGADMDRVAETARSAGVKWSREGLSWSRIEPVKGQFQWEYFDRLISTAKRNGISVYALLSGWAGWTKPYTEAGVDDYVAYARQVVRRYKNDIHHWEIWNEPNIFFWDGPKDLYATLLAKAYKAVKEEDPTAQVLGMSTSSIDYSFIARTMARGGPYDALTIHPYRKVLDDQVFINELKIASHLAGGKPVWITEMGWSVHTPHNTLNQDFAPNSLRAQAELIARTYLCTMVSGVHPNTSWYDFRDDGEDPIYFEHTLGILYRDYRPKPAFAAFSTMTRLLGGLQLAGKVEAGEGVFAYRFDGPRKLIALWSPNADVAAKLPSRVEKAELVNAIGESREFSGSAVPLKKSAPVYLILR